MTTLLHLTAYPLADLTPPTSLSSPDIPLRLSCLLQASALSSDQRLEVRVQGTELAGQWEDAQQVFTWQCAIGEAITICLWSHGKRSRDWLGCWTGDRVFLHAGTLAVQVSLAGQPQSASDPADLVPWLTATGHNGHMVEAEQHTDLSILAKGQSAEQERLAVSEPADPFLANDASVSVDLTHQARFPQEETSADVPGTEVLSTTETMRKAPAGTLLATWQADPAAGIEALQACLSGMPAKTLLVDLRQHPRRAVPAQTAGSLSKVILRQTFGARYWDRGWAIRTVQRQQSDHSGTPLCTVITNPHDPEGLPLLLDRLCRGYSLLLLDNATPYEQSPRAAVVAALQQQVPDLALGALS